MDENNIISTQIWLNFFNKYLYEQGLITEIEKNKMAGKIASITDTSLPSLPQNKKISKF